MPISNATNKTQGLINIEQQTSTRLISDLKNNIKLSSVSNNSTLPSTDYIPIQKTEEKKRAFALHQQTIVERWGKQTEIDKPAVTRRKTTNKARKHTTRRERRSAELKNIDDTFESYDEFVEKITKKQNRPEIAPTERPNKPLYTTGDAYNAAGSLIASGLNTLAQTIAEDYHINLKPKASPNAPPFLSVIKKYMSDLFFSSSNTPDQVTHPDFSHHKIDSTEIPSTKESTATFHSLVENRFADVDSSDIDLNKTKSGTKQETSQRFETSKDTSLVTGNIYFQSLKKDIHLDTIKKRTQRSLPVIINYNPSVVANSYLTGMERIDTSTELEEYAKSLSNDLVRNKMRSNANILDIVGSDKLSKDSVQMIPSLRMLKKAVDIVDTAANDEQKIAINKFREEFKLNFESDSNVRPELLCGIEEMLNPLDQMLDIVHLFTSDIKNLIDSGTLDKETDELFRQEFLIAQRKEISNYLDQFGLRGAQSTVMRQFWYGFKRGFTEGPTFVHFAKKYNEDLKNNRKMSSMSTREIYEWTLASSVISTFAELLPGVGILTALVDLSNAYENTDSTFCEKTRSIVQIAAELIDMGKVIKLNPIAKAIGLAWINTLTKIKTQEIKTKRFIGVTDPALSFASNPIQFLRPELNFTQTEIDYLKSLNILDSSSKKLQRILSETSDPIDLETLNKYKYGISNTKLKQVGDHVVVNGSYGGRYKPELIKDNMYKMLDENGMHPHFFTKSADGRYNEIDTSTTRHKLCHQNLLISAFNPLVQSAIGARIDHINKLTEKLIVDGEAHDAISIRNKLTAEDITTTNGLTFQIKVNGNEFLHSVPTVIVGGIICVVDIDNSSTVNNKVHLIPTEEWVYTYAENNGVKKDEILFIKEAFPEGKLNKLIINSNGAVEAIINEHLFSNDFFKRVGNTLKSFLIKQDVSNQKVNELLTLADVHSLSLKDAIALSAHHLYDGLKESIEAYISHSSDGDRHSKKNEYLIKIKKLSRLNKEMLNPRKTFSNTKIELSKRILDNMGMKGDRYNFIFSNVIRLGRKYNLTDLEIDIILSENLELTSKNKLELSGLGMDLYKEQLYLLLENKSALIKEMQDKPNRYYLRNKINYDSAVVCRVRRAGGSNSACAGGIDLKSNINKYVTDHGDSWNDSAGLLKLFKVAHITRDIPVNVITQMENVIKNTDDSTSDSILWLNKIGLSLSQISESNTEFSSIMILQQGASSSVNLYLYFDKASNQKKIFFINNSDLSDRLSAISMGHNVFSSDLNADNLNILNDYIKSQEMTVRISEIETIKNNIETAEYIPDYSVYRNSFHVQFRNEKCIISAFGFPSLTATPIGLLDGKQLAHYLKNQYPSITTVRTIELNSCQSAVGGAWSSQAQVLANELNINVIGYEGAVDMKINSNSLNHHVFLPEGPELRAHSKDLNEKKAKREKKSYAGFHPSWENLGLGKQFMAGSLTDDYTKIEPNSQQAIKIQRIKTTLLANKKLYKYTKNTDDFSDLDSQKAAVALQSILSEDPLVTDLKFINTASWNAFKSFEENNFQFHYAVVFKYDGLEMVVDLTAKSIIKNRVIEALFETKNNWYSTYQNWYNTQKEILAKVIEVNDVNNGPYQANIPASGFEVLPGVKILSKSNWYSENGFEREIELIKKIDERRAELNYEMMKNLQSLSNLRINCTRAAIKLTKYLISRNEKHLMLNYSEKYLHETTRNGQTPDEVLNKVSVFSNKYNYTSEFHKNGELDSIRTIENKLKNKPPGSMLILFGSIRTSYSTLVGHSIVAYNNYGSIEYFDASNPRSFELAKENIDSYFREGIYVPSLDERRVWTSEHFRAIMIEPKAEVIH